MGKRGKIPANRLPTTADVDQAMPNPSPRPSAEQRRWRAEDALRDIERAEGHKRDGRLMSDVKKVAAEKMENLKKVCK